MRTDYKCNHQVPIGGKVRNDQTALRPSDRERAVDHYDWQAAEGEDQGQ